jgi:hypothetical protein
MIVAAVITGLARAKHVGLAGFLMVAAASCAEGQVADRQEATSLVAATVGDSPITLAEVDAKALVLDASEFRGMSLGQALFEARQLTLDEVIADRLLEAEAEKQGVSKDDFVTREATGKLAVVSDAEVEKWYRENTTRVGGQPLDTVREPIRSLLAQVRRRDAIDVLVDKLRATTKVAVLLEPPRTEITIAESDPAVGPQQAAVEIIEFSDFQ